ncbi:MAG: hypothetical protein WAW86_02200 [Gammaproteobacteria bacterium]
MTGKDNKLVGWVFERACQDHWPFGLLLNDGTKMAINHISSVHENSRGKIWIDAELSNVDKYQKDGYFIAPTTRQIVTINVSKIIAIWELSDT